MCPVEGGLTASLIGILLLNHAFVLSIIDDTKKCGGLSKKNFYPIPKALKCLAHSGSGIGS